MKIEDLIGKKLKQISSGSDLLIDSVERSSKGIMVYFGNLNGKMDMRNLKYENEDAFVKSVEIIN